MSKPIRKSTASSGVGQSSGGSFADKTRLLDSLVTGLDTNIALLDADLNFVHVSEAFAAVRGITPEQLTGRYYSEVYRDDEHLQFERVRRTGNSAKITARPLNAADTAQSKISYWDCNLAPVHDGGSGIAGLLVTESDVTSRVRAEQSLHKVASILKAIDVAQNETKTNSDPQQLLDTLLAETIQITDSEYGFIGRVIHPDDGLPQLQVPTILNFSGNGSSSRLSVAEGSVDVELSDQETALYRVIHLGKPILNNDVENQPLRLGFPAGHPPLRSLLCLPLQGKVTDGVICVANCPEGYDPVLADALQPLMTGYVRLFETSSLAAERDAALLSLDQSRMLVRDLAVPAVENEHDELISLINQCYEEMEGEGDYATILRILRQLDAASAEHFRHEEQLMESIGYDELEDHRENHQLLLKALRKHIERYREDPEHDLYHLQEMLTSWFGRHFSTYDLRMNQHFAS